MSVATPFSDEQLREFAEAMVRFHDPANQQDNPYQRCAHCNYTRHPCDTFDLAAAVLRLLDREIIMTADKPKSPWGPEAEDWVETGGLTTVTVQHDASFNESPVSEWHAGDPPGPGQPGDASEAT